MAKTALDTLTFTPRESQDNNIETLRDMIQAIVDPIAEGYLGTTPISTLRKGINERSAERRAIPIEHQNRLLELQKERVRARLATERAALDQLIGKQELTANEMSLKQRKSAQSEVESGNPTGEELINAQRRAMGHAPVNPREVNVKQQTRSDLLKWVMDNVPEINNLSTDDERRSAAVDWVNTYDPESRAALGDDPNVSKLFKDVEYENKKLIKGYMAREQGEHRTPGTYVGKDAQNKPVINGKTVQRKYLTELAEKLPPRVVRELKKSDEFDDLINQLTSLLNEMSRHEIKLVLDEDARNLKKQLDERARNEFRDRLLRGKE